MGHIGDPHKHFIIVCEQCGKEIRDCGCVSIYGVPKDLYEKIKNGLCDACKKPKSSSILDSLYDCYD